MYAKCITVIVVALALSATSLNLSGTLTVMDGKSSFSGTLSALPDVYNMNPSNRPFMAELSTTVGRNLGQVIGSKPYTINILGDRPIQ